MKESQGKTVWLRDYRVPDYLIIDTQLVFELFEDHTLVSSRLRMRRNPAAGPGRSSPRAGASTSRGVPAPDALHPPAPNTKKARRGDGGERNGYLLPARGAHPRKHAFTRNASCGDSPSSAFGACVCSSSGGASFSDYPWRNAKRASRRAPCPAIIWPRRSRATHRRPWSKAAGAGVPRRKKSAATTRISAASRSNPAACRTRGCARRDHREHACVPDLCP